MAYTVSVNVEMTGVPHTWVKFTDADGNQTSYGYAPFTQEMPEDVQAILAANWMLAA